jgi:hypothetical protein
MAKPLIAPEIQSLAVSLQDLKLWPRNPRQGDVGALAESLKRFGQVRPILVQSSTMQIVAGNHLYRAAAALGWTEMAAIVTDMSDKQAKAFVAADNRMSELGGFDDAALAVLLADIQKNDTLEGTGYDADDLDALLAKVGTGKGFGKGDPDAQGAIPEETWVKDGMIFQLADHRLACGDGTVLGVLDRILEGAKPDLLIVQPPMGKGQHPKDIFDHFEHVPEQFWFEPQRYDLWQVGPDIGTKGHGSFVVWDKQSDNTNRDFGDAFELIYSKEQHTQTVLRHTFVGAADEDKHGGPDFNERPTALFMDIFERWSGFEALVLDPIALGGTALLAAEKTGRKYYGVKKDPAHVQATLEKWEEYVGVPAEEIGRASEG